MMFLYATSTVRLNSGEVLVITTARSFATSASRCGAHTRVSGNGGAGWLLRLWRPINGRPRACAAVQRPPPRGPRLRQRFSTLPPWPLAVPERARLTLALVHPFHSSMPGPSPESNPSASPLTRSAHKCTAPVPPRYSVAPHWLITAPHSRRLLVNLKLIHSRRPMDAIDSGA